MSAAEKKKKERSKQPLRDAVEVAVFAVVMALGLKVFAIEAYQIPTGSMMPTLMGTALQDPLSHAPRGGIYDRVLVNKLSFLLREPERWEVVVFRYPLAAHSNYVKRLVGMPNEDLWIEHGDLWARPLDEPELGFQILRKPPRIQNGLWKLCYPAAGDDPGRWSGWRITGEHEQREAGGVLLHAGARVETMSSFKDLYLHGYPEAVAARLPVKATAPKNNVVSDLKFELRATPAAATVLIVEAEFGPHLARVELDAAAGKVRVQAPDGSRTEAGFPFPRDQEATLRVACWDQQLAVELESPAGRWEHFATLDLEPQPATRNGLRALAAEGGWILATPRVWRDVYYLPPRSPARTNGTFTIPDGCYFMMGDNTQDSHDSRDWTAAEVALDPPVDGWSRLRGDQFTGSASVFTNNPRFNSSAKVMAFREQNGDLFTFPSTGKVVSTEPAPFVPREYVLGKPMAVFLPIPPFAPAWRIKTVR